MRNPHLDLKKTWLKKKRNAIGARVRAVRLASVPAITQEDLAGRVAARGVAMERSAIGRIESGDRYVLDYEAIALAAALRVPTAKLFT